MNIRAIQPKPELNPERAKDLIRNARRFYVMPASELHKLDTGGELTLTFEDDYSVRVCNRLGYGNVTDVVLVEQNANAELQVFTAQLFQFIMGFYRNAELSLTKTG